MCNSVDKIVLTKLAYNTSMIGCAPVIRICFFDFFGSSANVNDSVACEQTYNIKKISKASISSGNYALLCFYFYL